MALYKKYRKKLLKTLTKEQKKQYKNYAQEITDRILNAYAETIRLNGRYYLGKSSSYLPIDETNAAMRITLEVENRH